MSTVKRAQGMDIPVLKQVNSRAVLETLRTGGQMDRKEIARLTNLSVPTVWRLVNELMAEGILVEVPGEASKSARGRRSSLIAIDSSSGWIVSVDVGAAHMKAGAIDLAGGLHETLEQDMNTVRGDEAVTEALVSLIRRLIDELAPSRGHPMAIGISLPGTVDQDMGIVKLSFNLQLENYHVAEILTERFGIPVVISNNVSASALAEARIGFGREHRDFAYITVGYGIGAAYVFNGEIYVNPSRGEFGLMVVAPQGDPNRFGGRGYLEALASGSGIASAARRAIEAGERTLIKTIAPEGPQSVTARIVAEAASRGDRTALRIFQEAANYLGIAIVNVANTLGLRLFVINGGVSKAGPVFWDPLKAAVEKYEYWPGEIRLEPCRQDSNAALVGVGLLALNRVFEQVV